MFLGGLQACDDTDILRGKMFTFIRTVTHIYGAPMKLSGTCLFLFAVAAQPNACPRLALPAASSKTKWRPEGKAAATGW